MEGGIVPEELSFLQEMTVESYSDTPKENINGWILKKSTPNTKFWVKGNNAIVGVRGTKSSEDVSAWYTVPLSTLNTTAVYKKNFDAVREFKNEYPGIVLYGVGHSLGGAILDSLIRDGLIQEAVSYNPAIQYKDINGGLPNRRIYYGADPLYKLMGWWDRKSEHRKSTEKSWIAFLGNFSLPVAGMSALASHSLTKFTGGMHGGGEMTKDFMLRAAKIVKDVVNRIVGFREGNEKETAVVMDESTPRLMPPEAKIKIENMMSWGLVELDALKRKLYPFMGKTNYENLRSKKEAVIQKYLEFVRKYLVTHRDTLIFGPSIKIKFHAPPIEGHAPYQEPPPVPPPAPYQEPPPAPAVPRRPGFPSQHPDSYDAGETIQALLAGRRPMLPITVNIDNILDSHVKFADILLHFGLDEPEAKRKIKQFIRKIHPNVAGETPEITARFQNILTKIDTAYDRPMIGSAKPRKNRKN